MQNRQTERRIQAAWQAARSAYRDSVQAKIARGGAPLTHEERVAERASTLGAVRSAIKVVDEAVREEHAKEAAARPAVPTPAASPPARRLR